MDKKQIKIRFLTYRVTIQHVYGALSDLPRKHRQIFLEIIQEAIDPV